ncbi:DUF3806 domain-containing protein [Sessilibacter corallicola]|uniref:DUF3806 domain-containing protein n=1 Tax=Sessilibacter corallicola TaxID=2904075 RepID=A0ABQ0ACY3_9GAMM
MKSINTDVRFTPVIAKLLVGFALLCFTQISLAQFGDEKVWPKIEELGWLDNQHLNNQRASVNELAKLKLGDSIRGNKSDLDVLQRIIDARLIASDERVKLQALGVIIGDQFQREFNLVWRIYEDQAGRSRAVCFKDTEHCLFPITMLSRRMEVGLQPNVKKIYDETAEALQPLLPKLPYEVSAKK